MLFRRAPSSEENWEQNLVILHSVSQQFDLLAEVTTVDALLTSSHRRSLKLDYAMTISHIWQWQHKTSILRTEAEWTWKIHLSQLMSVCWFTMNEYTVNGYERFMTHTTAHVQYSQTSLYGQHQFQAEVWRWLSNQVSTTGSIFFHLPIKITKANVYSSLEDVSLSTI